MMRLVPNKPYDDPYAILADHLVATLSVKSLKKILSNGLFVKSMVCDEVKNLDIEGKFLDCVEQGIIESDRLRVKNASLKKLGEFYFSELDLPRLRECVRQAARECDIVLDDDNF